MPYLLVDVDGVHGPLVPLHADVAMCHRLVVLGADDYDDQVVLLKDREAQLRERGTNKM